MQTTKLGRFLASKDLSYRAFARRVGASPSEVWRWAAGERVPPVDAAFAIERETTDAETGEAAVPASYWSEFKTKRRKS